MALSQASLIMGPPSPDIILPCSNGSKSDFCFPCADTPIDRMSHVTLSRGRGRHIRVKQQREQMGRAEIWMPTMQVAIPRDLKLRGGSISGPKKARAEAET